MEQCRCNDQICAPDEQLVKLIDIIEEATTRIPELAIGNYVQGYRAAMSNIAAIIKETKANKELEI